MLPRHPFVALVTLLLSISAVAQTDNVRNATANDMQGYWELLPLPAVVEPAILPANPWPAECRWFYYGSNGQLKNFNKLRGPCGSRTPESLQEAFDAVPAVMSWRYDFSPVYQKGVLLIARSDIKDYGEIWEPQIVVKAFVNHDVAFEPGDLMLYLFDLKAHKIVWIRHLRKAG